MTFISQEKQLTYPIQESIKIIQRFSARQLLHEWDSVDIFHRSADQFTFQLLQINHPSMKGYIHLLYDYVLRAARHRSLKMMWQTIDRLIFNLLLFDGLILIFNRNLYFRKLYQAVTKFTWRFHQLFALWNYCYFQVQNYLERPERSRKTEDLILQRSCLQLVGKELEGLHELWLKLLANPSAYDSATLFLVLSLFLFIL